MKKQTIFTHQFPSGVARVEFSKLGTLHKLVADYVGVFKFTFEVVPFGLVIIPDLKEPAILVCDVDAEIIFELNKFNLTHTQPVEDCKTVSQQLDDASYALMRKLQARMDSGNFKFNEKAGIADFDGCSLQFIGSSEQIDLSIITVSNGDVFRSDLFTTAMRKTLFNSFTLAVQKVKEKKKADDQAKLNFIKEIKI